MANLRGRLIGSDDLVFEEFVPSSAWTEDSSSHFLLVDLPGFKKEDLKLQVDEHGHVVVSGERQTNNNKIIHFKETAKVPENSNMEKISGKYESEILYVIVPKRVKEEEEKKQDNVVPDMAHENHKDEVEKSGKETTEVDKEKIEHKEIRDSKNMQIESLGERWMNESGLLESAVQILNNNKGIVVTALLAFSLGFLLSQRFQSNTDSG